MKHPALTRMLGVFLAVVSVISLIAGALGFGRAAGDYREQQREDTLLDSRIQKAEALRLQMEEEQADYDAAMEVFPDRESAHSSARSDFRMKLATYTATRAGLVLGRWVRLACLQEGICRCRAMHVRGYGWKSWSI